MRSAGSNGAVAEAVDSPFTATSGGSVAAFATDTITDNEISKEDKGDARTVCYWFRNVRIEGS